MYLIINCNTINCLHWIRSEMYSGALETSTTELFTKTVSKVNIKPWTILAKRSILGPWLGPEHTSADRYNTVLKIQVDKSPWKQVNIKSLHLKFRSANCLSMSKSLKQLVKVSLRLRSQKYLFGKVSVNCYQCMCGGAYLW